MAFWGIEVKPAKPFTHTADDGRGRLHISQATLGIGTATKKSVVQCNVGNKSPVFLCSLFPEKAESCQLNLEFEEADEVVFSVIGPRSVHLTGYFVGTGHHCNLNDESESYGEDIADTETERSTGHSDEDKYEDSFIDDSDPKVFPPSPLSDVGEFEDTPDRKPKNVKDRRKRRRKKYQLSESDDDVGAQDDMNANGTVALDSENEDMLPISSLCKGSPATRSGKLEAEETAVEKNDDSKPASKSGKLEAEGKANNKSYETSNSNAKEEEHCFTIAERKVDAVDNGEPKRPNSGDLTPPSVEVGPENGLKPERKKKVRSKQEKDSDNDGCCDILKKIKPPQNETKDDKMVQNFPVRNEENQKTSDYNKDANLPLDFMPPSTQVGPQSDTKPRKRKRKNLAEEKRLEADNDHQIIVSIGDNALQDEVKPNSTGQDPLVRNEQNEKQANDKIFGDVLQSASKNQLEDKKKKRRKRKTNEDGKVMDLETPLLSMNEKSELGMDTGKSFDSKLSQHRTLSNGVVIEELEKTKPDGKVAASGKKISVLYIGKLKESGQVFDSNLGGAPFRFRLGGKDVIDGFNVGLEGMQVGEKRRIFIPPSMGYGSEGDGKNVPPNSSLVFDVELVKVHR